MRLAAGRMEAFKEAETDGNITLILGGKVLVVDIEFSAHRSDRARPKLSVISLKTSYASPINGAMTDRPISIHGFLMDYIWVSSAVHTQCWIGWRPRKGAVVRDGSTTLTSSR